jgi:hypothetical protein
MADAAGTRLPGRIRLRSRPYRRGSQRRDAVRRGSAAEQGVKVADQITADDLRPSGPEAVEILRGFLQKTTLPQGQRQHRCWYSGGQDSLIPRRGPIGRLTGMQDGT